MSRYAVALPVPNDADDDTADALCKDAHAHWRQRVTRDGLTPVGEPTARLFNQAYGLEYRDDDGHWIHAPTRLILVDGQTEPTN